MSKCISFSLYGDGAKYAYGMFENVRLAKQIYPGWTVVVHADRGHYAIPRLRAEGAEVHEVEPVPGSAGMFWRFLPCDWKHRFTHVIVRDADSRLNPRERAAVDEWIASGKKLHVMRDHEAHYYKPIMGGAWGIVTGSVPMISEVYKWKHNFQYGDDEEFLWWKVWEPLRQRNDFLRHARWVREEFDTPFPEHAPYDGFVCEQIRPVFNERFKAYVLSPAKYEKRRAKFYERLEQHGGFLRGKVEWWRGTTLEDRIVPDFFPHKDLPHYYLATKDHLDILEKTYLSGADYLFVFEDDAEFTDHFEETFFRAFLGLPSSWRGLYLGWQGGKLPEETQVNSAVNRAPGLLGLHAVLWNRDGMLRAYNHISEWHHMTVDQVLRGLQHDEPERFYATPTWAVHIAQDALQYGHDQ